MDVCQIPANPDIAGVGVRIAIYVQAYLDVLPTLLTLLTITDKPPLVLSLDRLSLLTTSATAILITGCGLLISAFVSSALGGLTVYHALIVLNLSWINNLTALALAAVVSSGSPGFNNGKKGGLLVGVRALWDRPIQTWNEEQQKAQATYGRLWVSVQFLIGVYILHFSAMSAFGLYLFSTVATFDVADGGCAPSTLFYFFGYAVTVTGSSFRAFWVVAYAIACIPLLNMFLCGMIAIALGALVGIALTLLSLVLVVIYAILLGIYKGAKRDPTPWKAPRMPRRGGKRIAFSLGLVGAVLLDALLIESTERMIAGNDTSPGENQWGFGQTLAMLLIVPPAGAIGLDALQFFGERGEDRRKKEAQKWGYAEGQDVLDELFVADAHRID